jgi:hypothetical protein
MPPAARREEPSTVLRVLRGLVHTACDVQRSLDEAYDRDFDAAASRLAPAGGVPPEFARHLADAIVRPAYALSQFRAEVALAATSSRTGGASVGLDVFARPAHSFYERRFSLGDSASHRLGVEVEFVPSATAPPEASRGKEE